MTWKPLHIFAVALAGWMNRQARQFVDELVEAVYECYGLPGGVPLISTGGSMGGLSSLIYTRYARRPVAACLAMCPVCDFQYHLHERPDLPPTIRYAMRCCKGRFGDLLKEHSPVCQVNHFPDIPYLVIHGDKDKAVNKERHSDRLVAKMRKARLDVTYIEVPGADHGGPFPDDVLRKETEFVKSALIGGRK